MHKNNNSYELPLGSGADASPLRTDPPPNRGRRSRIDAQGHNQNNNSSIRFPEIPNSYSGSNTK